MKINRTFSDYASTGICKGNLSDSSKHRTKKHNRGAHTGNILIPDRLLLQCKIRKTGSIDSNGPVAPFHLTAKGLQQILHMLHILNSRTVLNGTHIIDQKGSRHHRQHCIF